MRLLTTPSATKGSTETKKKKKQHLSPSRSRRQHSSATSRCSYSLSSSSPSRKLRLQEQLAQRQKHRGKEAKQGRTNTFVLAAQKGDLRSVLKAIKEQDQEIDAFHDFLQFSALHAAVDFSHAKVVRALLRHGADPDLQDVSSGNSSLHRAALHGRTEMIELLVEHGADKSLRNDSGKKPVDLASDMLFKKASDLLQEPPEAPKSLVAMEEQPRQVTMTWMAPDDNGVPIDGYDLRWRQSRCERPWSTGIDQVTKTKYYVMKDTNDIVWEEPEFAGEFCDRLWSEMEGVWVRDFVLLFLSLTNRPAGEELALVGKTPQDNALRSPMWSNLTVDGKTLRTVVAHHSLSPSTQYYFLLRAHNASGWSRFGEPLLVSTKDTVPSAPSAPMIISTTATSSKTFVFL